MRLNGFREPTRLRPADGWTEEQIRFAHGIVRTTPDVCGREFARRRRMQAAKFAAWTLIFVAMVSLSAVLIPIALVLLWVWIDFDYLTSYKRGRRDLEWASSVLAEDDARMPR